MVGTADRGPGPGSSKRGGAATIAKVLARGQVTLPSEVRREADVKPGDVVSVRATGAGTVELRVIRRLTLDELLRRFRIPGEIHEAADREAWEAAAAQEMLAGRDG